METTERLSSCDASDACDRLRVPAARTGLLRPLWPECPAVCGVVTTVCLEAAEDDRSPLPDVLDALAQASGKVVLLDLGGRRDRQAWGSVLATAAQHFGVRGVLVNGCARDVDEVAALAFPTYARGLYPGAMGGRLRLVAVDDPVEVDGGLVEPGSLAVADASGVVFVPAAVAEQVATLAAESRATEAAQLAAVAAGADPRSVFGAEPQP